MKPNKVALTVRMRVFAAAFAFAGCANAQQPAPVAVAAQNVAAPEDSDAAFNDLVRLVKSGADKNVLSAYIDAAPVPYHLSSQQLSFLDDLGVAPDVMKKLGETPENAGGTASPAAPAEAAPPVAPAVPAAPAHAATPVEMPAGFEPPPGAVIVTQTEPAGESAPQEANQPPAEIVSSPPEIVTENPEVLAPPSGTMTISTFYETLSPYGNWINIDGTWYWQPTVMVENGTWRPYCNRGHWVFTDCGWAWCSDYAWGWAPFHYGRWLHHGRFGWIWCPDNVWGPAWVCWRGNVSDIGWAPLPPGAMFAGEGFTYFGNPVGADFGFGIAADCYTFVPCRNLCQPVLTTCVLPPQQMTQIYTTTAVIPYSSPHHGGQMYNHGPSEKRIAEASHHEIPQLKIVSQTVHPGQPFHGNVVSKNNFSVYRPQVSKSAPESPQEIVAKQQAQVAAQSATRQSSAFNSYKPAAVQQTESWRGQASRTAAPQVRAVTPQTNPDAAARLKAQQDASARLQQEEAAARQRSEQEAAARQRAQQEAVARQQADLIRAQQAEQTDRLRQQQQAEADQRQQDAAAKLRAQQQDAARQQAALLRQQEADAARQREQAEADARLQEQQQAEARLRQEENAARQQAQEQQAEARQRSQQQETPRQQQPQQPSSNSRQQGGAFQGYGSGADSDSQRGANSRGHSF